MNLNNNQPTTEPQFETPRLSDLRFVETIRAFMKALFQRETYLLHRNLYMIFGLLWGIPIPIVTFGIALSPQPFTLKSIMDLLYSNPLYAWFLIHPLIFAVVFGAIGTLANHRERQIAELITKLQALADTDGLTELLNHRAFQEKIRKEAARAAREEQPISLLFADLDYFKRFNDRYGHPTGDIVLKKTADVLKSVVRPYDSVCRYGGEEFAIILPNTDKTIALQIAERIRQQIMNMKALPDSVGSRITLSIGLSARHPGESVEDWIERVDQRLYIAKEMGRNRVCCTGNLE